MTYEREPSTVSAMEIANSVEIRRTLIAAGLLECEDPLAAKLALSLEVDRRPFTVDSTVAVRMAGNDLAEHTSGTITDFTTSYREYVSTGYPQDITADAEQPESPRQFARTNGLDHRRTELREAHFAEVAESKGILMEAIDTDEDMPEGATVEDERLTDAVTTETAGLRQEVQTQVANVQQLLQQARTMSQGRFVIRRSKRVTQEQVAEQDELLHSSLDCLGNLLRNARHATVAIAHITASGFYAEVDGIVVSSLQSHYDGLVLSAMALLRDNISVAYEAVATLDRERILTAATQDTSPNGAVALAEAETSASEFRRQDGADEQVETVIDLGVFQNPFPWLDDETVRLSYVNGVSPFLFTTALPPKSRAISDHLRRQPENARRFDAIVDRVKGVEGSGNAPNHPQVKLCFDADFNDLTVCYYRTVEPNAPRIYYAHTRASRYPELLASLGPNFTADTRLIIQLAEVDKQNQLKVYQDLGINVRRARAGGGGPI